MTRLSVPWNIDAEIDGLTAHVAATTAKASDVSDPVGAGSLLQDIDGASARSEG
jgi:hypothetical protein